VKRDVSLSKSIKRVGSRLEGSIALKKQTIRYAVSSAGTTTFFTATPGPIWGANLTIQWLNQASRVLGSFTVGPTSPNGKVMFAKSIPAGAKRVRVVYAGNSKFNPRTVTSSAF
jgi:hypothetical protein